jgi:hypothetical protein
MLIVNYQAICLTTFPAAPPPPYSDNDNNIRKDNNHKDDPQEASIMSKAATKTSTAAAAAAAKKTATAKMPGKTEANYCLTAPSVRLVSKSCGLGTGDKFAMSYDTEGSTDFVLAQFYINGALPEKGGYLATLSEDGHTIRGSQPIDLFLFTMEHLHPTMGSKYL